MPLLLVFSTTQDDLWKNRALDLENECQRLKDNFEAAQTHHFLDMHRPAARTTEIDDTSKHSDVSLQPDVPTKKKSKQKQGPIDEPSKYTGLPESSVNLKAIQGLFSGHTFKSSLAGGKLFQALNTFFELAVLHDRPEFPQNAFLSATRRCIDALSVSLDYTVKKDMNFERLQTLDVLLRLVMDRSLPLVQPNSTELPFANDQTPNLYPLQLPYPNNGSVEQVDGRPLLLAFFQSIISTVHTCSRMPLAQNNAPATHRQASITCKDISLDVSLLVHSLVLESLRHLDEILTEPVAEIQRNRDKIRRLRHLAVKDSFWYLCSILHILIATQTRGGDSMGTSNPVSEADPDNSNRQDRQRSKEEAVLTDDVMFRMETDLPRHQEDYRASNRCPTQSKFACYNTSGETFCSSNDVSHDNITASRSSTHATHILLDDMASRMFLRVMESYFSLL
ncbi:hypothetical protein CPB84DRAFT_1267902 [Gymnopilus junonius]|uniref:Uncharacterized protein n=1 Tax=Gymnopilus junonius TaxID=109634 RepID=A0A9P5NL32_GYMJU|nr:hypothetical protein CPB84DRAFT_1267902 [Gymnopilus junonius]